MNITIESATILPSVNGLRRILLRTKHLTPLYGLGDYPLILSFVAPSDIARDYLTHVLWVPDALIREVLG